jgi:hypothetical protein
VEKQNGQTYSNPAGGMEPYNTPCHSKASADVSCDIVKSPYFVPEKVIERL